EENRARYYDQLLAVTCDGDWNGWIEYFLQAVVHQSRENIERARAVLHLYEVHKERIVSLTRSQFAIQTLDFIFREPIFTSTDFIARSQIPRPSAVRILNHLKDKVLFVMEEGRGNRPALYAFFELLRTADPHPQDDERSKRVR
ncbi:MAG: hypothetical protein WBA12_15090, partial [Catalinimonas sp.]